jgi:signal transduction histidine kinase
MKPTSLFDSTALLGEDRADDDIETLDVSRRSAAVATGGELATSWDSIRRWVLANTFVPTWWPKDRHPRAAAYLLALALQVLAATISLSLASVFTTFSFHDALCILAVALAAFTWGAAPSLAATVAGLVLLETVVLPHTTHGGLAHAGDAVEIVICMTVGAIISVVASQTERGRQRAVHAWAGAHAREEALREINQRTDEFLSIASHELRTPLASLKMALQLSERRLGPLRQVEGPDEGAHRDLARRVDSVVDLMQTAEQQVHRQERLVGDLLDVSRIRANRLEIRMAPCDLDTIVRDAVDEQRLAWPERTIELTVGDELPTIEADAHRVGQVVTNYLTNALKYSPPDAPVQVTLQRSGAEARVTVADRGPGLTTDQLAHIWDRFHRVPGIRQQSGSGAGLGLGLYICRTIVERHHGRVGVDSKPGKGSAFWFTVPLPDAT